MYKQVRKQRALVARVGILMKNSNNIKWGVSTADTLLLRALQTDRVTRHTHYATTIQPLSVMMMAALNRAELLNHPLRALYCSSGQTSKRRICRLSSCWVQARHFLQIWMSQATWILCTSSFQLRWPLHWESHFWNTQIKTSLCWRIPTVLLLNIEQ